jgi:hypothetical protein
VAVHASRCYGNGTGALRYRSTTPQVLMTDQRLRPPTARHQPRQVAQLCGSAEGLFALCNDGTIWQLLGGMWLPEPPIPQRQLAED